MLETQFESHKVQLEKFRERLRAMSDQELVDFGRALGRIPRRVSGVPDPFDRLKEAPRRVAEAASPFLTPLTPLPVGLRHSG